MDLKPQDLLALPDALRTGLARERSLAAKLMEAELMPSEAGALALIEVDPLLLTETDPPSRAPKVAQSVDGCRRSNAAPRWVSFSWAHPGQFW
jgi:hypothetical protein